MTMIPFPSTETTGPDDTTRYLEVCVTCGRESWGWPLIKRDDWEHWLCLDCEKCRQCGDLIETLDLQGICNRCAGWRADETDKP